MLKKSFLIIMVIFCFLCFTACNPIENGGENETQKDGVAKFDEDFLCGYYLTFKNVANEDIPNLSGDFEKDSAIKHYMVKATTDNVPCLSMVYGKNVLTDVKTSESNGGLTAGGTLKLEAKLYFTYELLNCTCNVNFIYFNEDTEKVSIVHSAGTTLLSSLTNIGMNEEIKAKDSKGQETDITYAANIMIYFEYCDYLIGVKALEFDNDNNIIKTTDLQKENANEYKVSETCEYAIVEEQFIKKNIDGSNADTYYVRTLINKNDTQRSIILKYPCGNGLIEPQMLNIVWNN